MPTLPYLIQRLNVLKTNLALGSGYDVVGAMLVRREALGQAVGRPVERKYR